VASCNGQRSTFGCGSQRVSLRPGHAAAASALELVAEGATRTHGDNFCRWSAPGRCTELLNRAGVDVQWGLLAASIRGCQQRRYELVETRLAEPVKPTRVACSPARAEGRRVRSLVKKRLGQSPPCCWCRPFATGRSLQEQGRRKIRRRCRCSALRSCRMSVVPVRVKLQTLIENQRQNQKGPQTLPNLAAFLAKFDIPPLSRNGYSARKALFSRNEPLWRPAPRVHRDRTQSSVHVPGAVPDGRKCETSWQGRQAQVAGYVSTHERAERSTPYRRPIVSSRGSH